MQSCRPILCCAVWILHFLYYLSLGQCDKLGEKKARILTNLVYFVLCECVCTGLKVKEVFCFFWRGVCCCFVTLHSMYYWINGIVNFCTITLITELYVYCALTGNLRAPIIQQLQHGNSEDSTLPSCQHNPDFY